MKNRQFVVILIVLAVAMAVSLPLYLSAPRAADEAQVDRFPMTFDGWQGKDLHVEERAYEILETKNLILREYTKGDSRVFLYVIYSQDNRKVSHPPEVCFEGSGVTITHKEKMPMTLADGSKIAANKITVERQGVENIVVYWYKAGRVYVDNYVRQQLRIALDSLRFKRTSGALIRVSTEVREGRTKGTIQEIKDFSKSASVYFQEILP